MTRDARIDDGPRDPARAARPEVTYRCYREGDPANDTFSPLGILRYVVVRDGVTRTLTHDARHVGCGPAWKEPHPARYGCLNHGYGGSGPSDLARSILADYLGATPHPALYHEFKRAVTARFHEGAGWSLPAWMIDAWLRRVDVVQLPWIEPPDLAASLAAHRARRQVEVAARERLGVPLPDDDQWLWLEVAAGLDEAEEGGAP